MVSSMPFVPEVEKREKEKLLLAMSDVFLYSHSCISSLQQMELSHWFLLFSLRVHLSYLSITDFHLE